MDAKKPVAMTGGLLRPTSRLSRWVRSREAGVLLALVLLVAFFSIATPTFRSSLNILNMLRQVSGIGIVTVAMTMLIIGREFDLSVGSIYAVVGMSVAILYNNGTDIWLAALIGLAIALAMGFVNGIITVKGGIPSFIVTLGTMMVYRGVALLISGGQPRSVRLPQAFYALTGARLENGIPVPALWFLLAVLIGYIVVHTTGFGFRLFATGGNEEAARLSGISTDRVKIIGFMATALAAGVASIVALSYLGSVTPTQGQGMELQVIAASVIGGTSLFGGVGSVAGAFMGALIMGIVRNGLVLLGTGAYVQDLIIGLVVIAAVLVGTVSARSRR